MIQSGDPYDIVIVGAGPGGYVAAIRAAQLRARVALVEKEFLGGACLNRGCIPTKTLVESVEMVERVREASEFGVDVSSYSINFVQMMKRKDEIGRKLRAGVESLMKAHRIDVFRGLGTILKPGLVRVAESGQPGYQELHCRNIVLATRSMPAVLPIPGTKLPGVITSTEALELAAVPKSMVVVGGGVTAVEFTRILRPLGTAIQLVKRTPKILPPADDEIAQRYAQILRSSGVGINVGARVREIVRVDGGLRLIYDTDEGE